MERYFKRLKVEQSSPSPISNDKNIVDLECAKLDPSGRKQIVEYQDTDHSHTNNFDLDCLKLDPAERKQIVEYHPNVWDRVRSYYINKGPFQPMDYDFPRTSISGKMRRFQLDWFNGRFSKWLEYSIKADAAFCFCCFLFKDENDARGKARDSFTKNGFKSWNKALEKLKAHVGDVNSVHSRCFNKMLNLKSPVPNSDTLFSSPFLAPVVKGIAEHDSEFQMERYLKRLKVEPSSSSFRSSSVVDSAIHQVSNNPSPSDDIDVVELECLKLDPAERKQIAEYYPNMRDQVRRYYIEKGPFQTFDYDFPRTSIAGKMRRFQRVWFNGRFSKWLEYSIKADAAFCLCCYLFKNENEAHGKAGDSFTKNGFKSWNKALERLKMHVGDVNSVHNRCFNKMLDLTNQSESSGLTFFDKYSEKEKNQCPKAGAKNVDSAIHRDSNGAPTSGDRIVLDLEYSKPDPTERNQIVEYNPLDDINSRDLACCMLDLAERKQIVEYQPPAIHKISSPSRINILDLDCFKLDPAERKPVVGYHPDMRDQVRGYYIKKGPFQPIDFDFPRTLISGIMRRFQRVWFNGPYSEWLEYSIKADAAFCLCCFLFKNGNESQGKGGGDSFTKNGFKSWNKVLERLKKHVGDVNSVHNRCYIKMLDFTTESQSMDMCFDKYSEKEK